ncbi:MAG: hypothetical protein LBG13_02705 [Holosporales bacterium]|nr:hypothetical protein [Holosporales bacterium]
MGQKFFLHKNKKACYHIIDTCSCGLCYPGKLAGVNQEGVGVCFPESTNNPEKPIREQLLSLPSWDIKK